MKTIKIILVLVVVGLICFFVIKSLVFTENVVKVTESKSPFIERIEKEISEISLLPNSRFCKETYDEINYHIEDYYNNQRLGKNKSENDQWKENLSKELYSAYADKFIKQSFFVFKGSEWPIMDVHFIRSEYQLLKKSPFLENGSPVDNSLLKIRQILSKYDLITNFISNCKSFSYSDYSLSSRFPISDAQNKIEEAKAYSINMGNSYLNKCTRLHVQLNEIPQILFRAHVRYLYNKIYQWQDLYSNYNSQSDYANNLFRPLKLEIEMIDNSIYNARDFDKEYNTLISNLNSDSKNAYIYFSKKNKQME